MTPYCLRLLLIATILLLSGGVDAGPASAVQQPGDEHWAGDLTLSGFDGFITRLVSDQHGNTYAGGDFTSIDSEMLNHIARWDGMKWSALGNGLERPANNLALDSRGNLYTDVLVIPESGLPETLVMRWDGSAWSPLPGDLSSLVDTLAEGRESNILINDLVTDSRDQLYAGGYFYLAMSDQYVGYVARWDGSHWTLLGSGMDHTVYHLAVDGDDNLYAGGEFTTAGGVPANRIAQWDGDAWKALGSGLGGQAPTIADLEADENGSLYITGQFETVGDLPAPLIARWDGSAWSDLAPGTRQGWFEGESAAFFDLFVSQRGDLYAGGSFTTIDSVEAHNIARWDGKTWSALGTAGGNGVNERVYAISVDEQEQVFLGGYFKQAGGQPANHFAMWDGSTWSTWMEGKQTGLNGMVSALVVDPSGDLYAGGYFTTAGNTPANHIARWDGQAWQDLSGGTDSAVHALALDENGRLYAGGEFTTAGGTAVSAVASWDGATWRALGSGMGSDHSVPYVWALAVDAQGNLFAGGDFTTAGGAAASYIARWDGTEWSPLGKGMDDQVTALRLDPQGNLYAVGWFSHAGDVEANRIARWDGSTWSALGSGTGMVEALAIDQDGNMVAAGMFYPPEDTSSYDYLARWNGADWSAFGSGVDNLVHTLAVDTEGILYAAGDFSAIGGTPTLRIARWDGSTWNPLGSGIGAAGDYSTISTLVTDDRGDLYVGGQFTLAGNKPSAFLAKWCAELEAGACTFAFDAETSTAEPTPESTETILSPTLTSTSEIAAPLPTATQTPANSPAGAIADPGRWSSLWIGAGVLVAILLVGTFVFVFRRNQV